MRRHEELSITGIDTSFMPDLTEEEMGTIINQVRYDDPMSPIDVSRFLDMDCSDNDGLRRILNGATSISAMSLAAAMFARTEINMNPLYHSPWTVDPFVHHFLNVAANILPGQFTTPTNDIAGHLPTIFMAGAVTGVAVKVGSYVDNKRLNKRASLRQDELLTRLTDGKISWDMSEVPGAFINYCHPGSTLATTMAEEFPDQMVILSNQKASGVWTHMPETASRDEMMHVLMRAGVLDVEGLIISTSTPKYELFPPSDNQPERYVFGIPRDQVVISRADALRRHHGLDPLPVAIIGDQNQQVITVTTHDNNRDHDDVEVERLVDVMAVLAERRGAPIEVIDWTEAVVQELHRKVDHSPLVLSGSPQSVERYASGFYDAVNNLNGCEAKTSGESPVDPVKAVYNISGRMSAYQGDQLEYDDVGNMVDMTQFIILDPSQALGLEHGGVPRENILVVPDIGRHALTPYLESIGAI